MSEIRIGKADSTPSVKTVESDSKTNKTLSFVAKKTPCTLSGKPDFLKRGLEGIEANETTVTKKIQKTFSKNVHYLDDKK